MRQLTSCVSLSLVLAGLAVGGPARAQPFLFPLEPQKPAQPEQQAGTSSPPVAPPQAGPSLPSTTDTAGGPTVSPREETASQPEPSPRPQSQ